ncbi:DNA-processing protein DprA [Candidatus Saccharibacteria bacterium]|nr:DNA-processing protein DprA [Candidatus Saccharibacteria bacterium]
MSTLFSHFFQKINQISPLEDDFTEVLDSIAVKPKTLYFYGKMPQNVVKSPNPHSKLQNKTPEKSIAKNRTERPKTVAIVGSRHNTRYGEEVAYKLAYELGKRGVVVVSGLAYGIDSIGHRGCLDAGGITVAVLGTAIDHIYPRNHLSLAAEIIEKGGAVMSEYAPGYNPIAKFSFLERNRLISGLSDIVVVVEAAEKSGSLNTAMHALDQGKTVFAVPGNITSPYSQGCNKLIKEGALPYTEPADVLRELFPEEFVRQAKKQAALKLFGDNDVETLILQAIYAGARSGEQIMELTHLPPEVFSEATTMLEVKSRIRSLGMNHWGLC